MPAAPAVAAAAEVAAAGAGEGDTAREEGPAKGDVVSVLRLGLALVGGGVQDEVHMPARAIHLREPVEGEGAVGGVGCRTGVVAGGRGEGLPAPAGEQGVGAVAGVEARPEVGVTAVLVRTRLFASAMTD